MADSVAFDQVCSLLEDIFKRKGKKQEQYHILTEFFNTLKQGDSDMVRRGNLFPIMRLLLPDLDRERSAYNLKEKKLGQLLVKVLSLAKTSTDAEKLLHFRAVKNSAEGSDFPSVAYFVINSRMGNNKGDTTVAEVNQYLDQISAAQVGSKATILDEVFTRMIRKTNARQAKWLLRIILKDLKLGIGKGSLLSAMHPDAADLYDQCTSLLKVCEDLDDSNTRPPDKGIELNLAVSPMLSERLDITQINEVLPADKVFQVETKFDGERFQIHMKDGMFEYFSRRGFNYSDKFGRSYESGGFLTPWLKGCFKKDVDNFILDGEMMGWHSQLRCFGSKGMSFDIKKVTDNSKFRPCFCAFDVLYYNGRSLVGGKEKGGMPLSERLNILDDMFIDKEGVIMHSRKNIVNDRLEILEALNKAIENQEEGIVVKEIDSYYLANKRNAGWYKAKPEYSSCAMDDLDVVVIGADFAKDKSLGLANSFHIACADQDGDELFPSRWLAIGKVASGLTFEEREKICTSLGKHWKRTADHPIPPKLIFNKEKPDLWVLPEYSVVFTIRASELVPSREVATTYTLRFPRILALREDKPFHQVITLTEFNALHKSKSAVVKLSNRRIDSSRVADIVPRKSRAKKTLTVGEAFRSYTPRERRHSDEMPSKALLGRSVCVLSDDDDCPTMELERIALSHGAHVTKNPTTSSWLCFVGRHTYRVRNAILSGTCDVAPSAWLRSLPSAPHAAPLPHPLDMIYISARTRLSLSREYDVYCDSYKDDATIPTLRKCFTKMDKEKEPPVHLSTKEMLDLDKELFENGNPHSFLRGCVIRMKDERSALAIKAMTRGAKLSHDTTSRVTHCVMPCVTSLTEDACVVSELWLTECFLYDDKVDETPFIIHKED